MCLHTPSHTTRWQVRVETLRKRQVHVRIGPWRAAWSPRPPPSPALPSPPGRWGPTAAVLLVWTHTHTHTHTHPGDISTCGYQVVVKQGPVTHLRIAHNPGRRRSNLRSTEDYSRQALNVLVKYGLRQVTNQLPRYRRESQQTVCSAESRFNGLSPSERACAPEQFITHF